MILILGGAFQGKLSYALELTGYRREDFADGADCSWDAVFSARGIYHFEEYIRRCLKAGRSCAQLAGQLKHDNSDAVIIARELGYGIVPCDPFDRAWRETTGRICTELAKDADKVYRSVCGGGMIIKDDDKN